jgi:hypothetical protein
VDTAEPQPHHRRGALASSPMVTVQQEIDGIDGDAEEFESTAGLLPPAVAPPSVSGLWRSTGAVKDGLLLGDGPLQRATLIHEVRAVAEEEFLKLEVSADGKVSGMIDSDGSGDWSEKDYKVEGGSFDTSTLELRFNHAADHHFGNVRARCTSRLTTVHNDDAATHNCRDEA